MPNHLLFQSTNLQPLSHDTILTALGLVDPTLCDEIKSTHWYTFGLALGLSEEALSDIEGSSEEDRLNAILSEWLSSLEDGASWQALVEVLRSPLLHFLPDTKLADEIDIWCATQGPNICLTTLLVQQLNK